MENDRALSFDEETHTYTFQGTVIPSVTEIMRPLSEKVYSYINPYTLRNAADKGTRVHRAIQFWIEFGYKNTDEETEPYFEQFMRFKDDFGVKFLKSEFRLFHKYLLYAGTADMLISMANPKGIGLVDVKTTTTIHEGLLSVQLAAYKEAMQSMGHNVDYTAVLLLRPEGYTFRQIEPDFGMFLNCLAIYRFNA